MGRFKLSAPAAFLGALLGIATLFFFCGIWTATEPVFFVTVFTYLVIVLGVFVWFSAVLICWFWKHKPLSGSWLIVLLAVHLAVMSWSWYPLRLHFWIARPILERYARGLTVGEHRIADGSIGGFNLNLADKDRKGVVSLWTSGEPASGTCLRLGGGRDARDDDELKLDDAPWYYIYDE